MKPPDGALGPLCSLSCPLRAHMPPPASLVTLGPQTPRGWAATAVQNIPSQDCLLPLGLVTLTLLKGLRHGPGATSTFEEMGTGQAPLFCVHDVWSNCFIRYQCLGTGLPMQGTGEWLLTPSSEMQN